MTSRNNTGDSDMDKELWDAIKGYIDARLKEEANTDGRIDVAVYVTACDKDVSQLINVNNRGEQHAI